MTPSGPSPTQLAPGSLFHGRYEIVRCIKAGGMGAVYEVIHLETKRRRALKVMLPSLVEDADLRARFELEATVAAEVHSEHIVETFDAGIDRETGTPFIVMELLRGQELGSSLKQHGAMSPTEAVGLLFQAALALERTHAASIVHRDLKPENLFVAERDDGSPHLVVLDFGIAKVVERGREAARSTRGMGTPLYMSPEQIHGETAVGPYTDLYALGNIAYAVLVGEAYWEEEMASAPSIFVAVAKVVRGAEEAATARALRRKGVTLPPAFDAWFAKATAVLPERRFARAMDLMVGLAEVLGAPLPKVAARSRGMSQPVSAETPTLPRDSGRAEGDAPPMSETVRAITSKRQPTQPGASRRATRLGLLGGAIAVLAAATVATLMVGSLRGKAPVSLDSAPGASPATRASSPSPAASSPTVSASALEPASASAPSASSSAAPVPPAAAVGASPHPLTPRSSARPATSPPKDPLDER